MNSIGKHLQGGRTQFTVLFRYNCWYMLAFKNLQVIFKCVISSAQENNCLQIEPIQKGHFKAICTWRFFFLFFLLNWNLIMHASLFIWKYLIFPSVWWVTLLNWIFSNGFLEQDCTSCQSEEQLMRKQWFFLKKKSFILMAWTCFRQDVNILNRYWELMCIN